MFLNNVTSHDGLIIIWATSKYNHLVIAELTDVLQNISETQVGFTAGLEMALVSLVTMTWFFRQLSFMALLGHTVLSASPLTTAKQTVPCLARPDPSIQQPRNRPPVCLHFNQTLWCTSTALPLQVKTTTKKPSFYEVQPTESYKFPYCLQKQNLHYSTCFRLQGILTFTAWLLWQKNSKTWGEEGRRLPSKHVTLNIQFLQEQLWQHNCWFALPFKNRTRGKDDGGN